MRALFGGQLLGPLSQEEMVPPLGNFSSSQAYGLFRVGVPDNLTFSIAYNRGINGNAILTFYDRQDAGFALQCVDGRYGGLLFTRMQQWMSEFLGNRIQP
jgi:hypothetical protein